MKNKNVFTGMILSTSVVISSVLSCSAQEQVLGAVTAAGNSVTQQESGNVPNIEEEMKENWDYGHPQMEKPATDIPQVLLKKHAEYKYDEDQNRYLGHVSWQGIRLTSESALEFPLLQDSLEAWNEQMDGNAKEIEKNLFDPEFLEFYQEEMELTYEDSLLLCRADRKVLSFLDEHSEYTGGVHGYYSLTGFSYDVQSGAPLSLAEVIPDDARLREVLGQKLKEEYPADSYFSMENIDEKLMNYGYADDLSPYVWVIGREGVTFIFNPYEIASYAEGLISTQVRFADYPDLFEESWTITEDGFEELVLNQPETISLGDEGEHCTLTISPKYEEIEWDSYDDTYRPIKGYDIQIGDLTLTHEAEGSYNIRPLLLYRGSDRFLYLELTFDNDWKRLDIIRIADKVPTFVTTMWNIGPGWDYDPADETYGELLYTDPDAFCMGTRINLLSTYSGLRYYYVDADGVPQPYDTNYYRNAENAMPLVTTRELNSRLIDTMTGQVTEEPCQIAAGEELTIWRTDGISYVDFLRTNGTAVRLEVENGDSWPHIVDGFDENDCFEMLYYAG